MSAFSQGPIPWSTYTPNVTFSGGSGTGSSGVTGQYRLNGNELTINVGGTITYGSVPLVKFSLPSGLSAANLSAVAAINGSTGGALSAYVSGTDITFQTIGASGNSVVGTQTFQVS